MSLVGSLEDLGLGDILQIVNLSRKSGLLLLRSDAGEGRIVFRDGLVRAAFAKGEPEDLRGLLVGSGFVSGADFDRAVETARSRECALEEAIVECAGISIERLESLRREQVERAVLRVFTWHSGEFSFDVRDEVDERDKELLLSTGINTQYLAMEASRVRDESGRSGRDGASEPAGTDSDAAAGPVFSGEGAGSEGTPEPTPPTPEVSETPDVREALALSAARRVEAHAPDGERVEAAEISPPQFAEPPVPEFAEPPVPEFAEPPVPEFAEPPVPEFAEPPAPEVTESPAPEVTESPAPEVTESPAPEVSAAAPAPALGTGPAGLIAVDPDLDRLEWLKTALGGLFRRIHIFQRCDGGVARIRQYLGRAEVPLVLLSAGAQVDPLTGVRCVGELVGRLKALAPRMPVLVIHEQGADLPPGVEGADALLTWPERQGQAHRRRRGELEDAAGALREQLRTWAERSMAPSARSQRRRGQVDAGDSAQDPNAPGMRRLKEMSRRVRDPSSRGDVLFLVLEFAAECFSRVAMFMLRDDVAEGMAQVGLNAAGGPDDEEFRRFQIAADEPGWFRRVIEGRRALRSTPSDHGDWQLTARLGTAVPEEAYVAPIESGDRVVALLYGDNLPGSQPIGDTTALEILLLEAGLALDRALLERTLADVERHEGDDGVPSAEG